jgi:hypothetical protein
MKNEIKKIGSGQIPDKQARIIFLVCGNDGVGKKSILNEWKKKFRYQEEEDKSFYKVHYFSCEHRIDDVTIPFIMEIRILNGRK